MNLADPELELIDPTPNIHSLFLHFDKIFFWAQLASRAVVRWSKRMYSCAGVCSYDRGGMCDIALSEPLLKLRPRKNLVETLLHEMIHAYLFITNSDRDRDGHGPNFQRHMHRINKAAGLNITIYHDFHDEVKLYQTHWWRCNGPCQSVKPHFGIVRRSMNRAPGPSDWWWSRHKKSCGGTFVKCKEPEKPQKKNPSPKPTSDISKYIKKTNKDNNNGKNVSKPVLQDSSNLPDKSNTITKITKSNTPRGVVATKKNNVVFNPQVPKPPVAFSGEGRTINDKSTTSSADVVGTVRNVWANKDLSMTSSNKKSSKKAPKVGSNSTTLNKHKAEETDISSPPAKIKKIDDYFKSNVTSVLKDLYGKDFVITEVNSNKRLSVVQSDLVDCPVCSSKISNTEINRHLDECLNKETIETICKENGDIIPAINIESDPDKVNNNIPKNAKDTNDKNNESLEKKFLQSPTNETECIDSNVPNSTHVFNNKGQPKDRNTGAIKTSPVSSDHSVPKIKIEPGCSEDMEFISEQNCPCCGNTMTSAIEHLDECLAFFDNNTTIPAEGASTSFTNDIIVIDDDDDICDETLTLNATGTKSPCPCCLKMIELADMNDHLDICLS